MQPELQPVNTGYGGVAIPQESQKVLRNTYMLLALTMVPTVIGAWVGIQLAPLMVASPFITFFVMLGDRPAGRHHQVPQQPDRHRPAAADDTGPGRVHRAAAERGAAAEERHAAG